MIVLVLLAALSLPEQGSPECREAVVVACEDRTLRSRDGGECSVYGIVSPSAPDDSETPLGEAFATNFAVGGSEIPQPTVAESGNVEFPGANPGSSRRVFADLGVARQSH